MNTVELTPVQQECVEFPQNKDLAVRGVAGSGKSLVVAHRAVRFARAARKNGAPIRVAIFTYVNTLVDFTRETINRDGSDVASDITVSTLDKAVINLYRRMTGRQVSVTYKPKEEIDSAVKSVGKPDTTSRQRIVSEERRSWLQEEVAWMKQRMFSTVEEYLESTRRGRGRVRLERADRPFVFEIYKAFYDLLEKEGIVTIDMMCEVILKSNCPVPENLRYDVVLIDEAQDFPVSMLLVARKLCRSAMTIAADFRQKIYSTGFTWKEIGLQINRGNSKKLQGTFRNTKQIALLAMGLAKHNTESFEDEEPLQLEIPDREGPLPVLYKSGSSHEYDKIFAGLVRGLAEDAATQSIAVLVRSNIDHYVKVLVGLGIACEKVAKNMQTKVLAPGFKVATYHSAKGLEFDQVILPDLVDGKFPYTYKQMDFSEEACENRLNEARNLLYVGMTRARTMLYMLTRDTPTEDPSPLLAELDPELMKTVE